MEPTTETALAVDLQRKDVYQVVTDRIVEQLEKGTVPWLQPWRSAGIPRNAVSKKPYRGINIMLLASLGFEHNLFLTYKQIKDVQGRVKRDEKPSLVVFWNYGKKGKSEDAAKEELPPEEPVTKKKAILRYYLVYNIAQCEGLPISMLPVTETVIMEDLPKCEDIVANMPKCPPIKHKEQSAYYDPLRDFVNMPKTSSFKSMESYYATLYHELIHSTGHHSRLCRKDLIEMHEFGSDEYSHEELVAEIGTCYLQSYAGINVDFQQSTAYIMGWLEKLKNDRRFIISASYQAQKATDFILNIKSETDEEKQFEEQL